MQELRQKYVVLSWIPIWVFSCNWQIHVTNRPHSPYMPENGVYCTLAMHRMSPFHCTTYRTCLLSLLDMERSCLYTINVLKHIFLQDSGSKTMLQWTPVFCHWNPVTVYFTQFFRKTWTWTQFSKFYMFLTIPYLHFVDFFHLC